MKPTIAAPKPAHCVKMTYCGPTNTSGSRWHATWEGWPSDGPKRAGRYIAYDYAGNRDAQMMAAALAFCQWLGKMPGDDAERHYIPTGVTYGSLSPDSWVILFHAERIEDADHA